MGENAITSKNHPLGGCRIFAFRLIAVPFLCKKTFSFSCTWKTQVFHVSLQHKIRKLKYYGLEIHRLQERIKFAKVSAKAD
jgi:hypothetical protein